MTALRFPAKIAAGEVWWEDARESGGWGELPAIGVVDVPDGTAVRLNAGRGYNQEEAVDLEFIRGLPADSVFELNLIGAVVPASFAAVAHLAPGLRDLSVYIDNLGEEAPSVIAELTALERLSLAGRSAAEDGTRDTGTPAGGPRDPSRRAVGLASRRGQVAAGTAGVGELLRLLGRTVHAGTSGGGLRDYGCTGQGRGDRNWRQPGHWRRYR